MPTFNLTAFYIIPPSPTQAPNLHVLMQLEAGDTITGSFGMGNPLPADDPDPDGALSLYVLVGSGPDGENLDTLNINGGGQAEEASYGQNGTFDPIEQDSGPAIPTFPLVLDAQPDNSDPRFGGTGSYLVRISLTVTNPNRTEPPPLLSQAAKSALNATTEQLDTLSRGFDILNAGNAGATGLKSANWLASTSANVVNPQAGFANSVGQATLAIGDTIKGTTEEGGNPVPLILGGISAIYALTGVVTAALAMDPPDGDYTEVYQLPALNYDVPNASAVDNAILNDSYNFLGDTLDMLIASERYQGAILAGDTASATLQTNEFNTAQANSLTDAALVSSDLTAFQQELVNDGYTDQGNSDGSLASVQSEIATNGTADPFLANLITETEGLLGPTLAQAEAQQLVTDAVSLTATPISGTVFSGIGGASTALSEYADGTLQCFLEGTLIRTILGDVPVEHLAPGDRIALTDDAAPAVWIGHRRVDAARHPDPRAVWPVRIAAGAFGPGEPYRDLFLSPDHAVYVMDVLVPVKYLIDGRSVAQVPMAAPVYFHVQLPRHDVLFANGLAVESYLDLDDRACFDNDGPVVQLFPRFALLPSPRTAAMWETKAVAPLVMAGDTLSAVRRVVARHSTRLTQLASGPASEML